MKVITKESRAKALGFVKDPPKNKPLPSFEQESSIPEELWPIELMICYERGDDVKLLQIVKAAIEIAKLCQPKAPKDQTLKVIFYFDGKKITVDHESKSGDWCKHSK
jgi:hypothetical protein